MSFSTSIDTPPPAVPTGAGSWCKIAESVATLDGPWKARRPVSIS
jgi:hypothetical protein